MSYRLRKRLFLLLLPLFLGAVALSTRVETDLNPFFTATASDDAAFLASLLQSGELSRRYLLAVESPPGRRADPTPFAEALRDRLSRLADVERVWLASRPPPEWLATVAGYAPYHARMFSLEPATELAALLAPERLPERAAALQRLLLSPQGAFIKPVALHDPLLLSLQAFRDLASRWKTADAAAPQDNATGFAGLILQARPPSLDTAAQERLQAAIRAEFAAESVRDGGPGFQLSMTGVPVYTVAAQGQIVHDVTVVSTVSTAAVTLIFLIIFRSFKAMHWVLLIVAASFGVGALATSLWFGNVHSLTLALGSTLTGVSIDYPMHVLAHTAQFRAEAPDQAVRRVWPSLFVGALTTVVGYVALGLTSFPGFQQVAVFSAAAIFAALLLTRYVLPALLLNVRLRPPAVPLLSGWSHFCQRRRTPALVGLTAFLAGAALTLPQLRWNDDLSRLAMDMSALNQQDQHIRARLAGIEPGRFVLIKGTDLESALQASEAVERRLRRLKASGAINEYFGLYPWLVSLHLQNENAAAYRPWTDREAFRQAWRASLEAANLSADKLGRLPPVSGALAPSPEVRHILSGQIVEQAKGVALVIWLGPHQPEAVTAAVADIPGARYFSQKDLINHLARDYREQSLAMLGGGLLAIYGLLALRYRRPGPALFSLLPALIASLMLFAVWSVLQQEISFLHVMCLLLAVSICEDYGIFFLDTGSGDRQATYQAIAPSMLTTTASFAALGLAENPTLRTLGAGVTAAVTLGFLLCPLLIRSGMTPMARRPGDRGRPRPVDPA